MEKELYWIKPRSTFFLNGKSWDVSKPIPTTKVSKFFLEKNIAEGNIGEIKKITEILSKDAKEEILRLRKENDGLRKENIELKSKSKKKKNLEVKE